jgi:hypothetical protein
MIGTRNGLFFSKESYIYDPPNLVPFVIEPVLFIDSNISGRFWGKIGEFGRNQQGNKNSGHEPPRGFTILEILYSPKWR